VGAGGQVRVTVRAHHDAGRLVAVGYTARALATPPALLDSVMARFGQKGDSVFSFTLRIPANLPPDRQIDLHGLAESATGSAVRSTVRSIVVRPCAEIPDGC
jgi:hypothetical protein